MKTILEDFLDCLDISYTRHYAQALFQEHPHKYNMYGLKRMLDVYGVKALGVSVDDKNLIGLNYPCILHIHGDFVIGLDCGANTITYMLHGKKTTVAHDAFGHMWTGNALIVEETTQAVEPDYEKHRREEFVRLLKDISIPVMLASAVVMGIASNFHFIGIYDIMRMALASFGILVSGMLLEKQLLGGSNYGDKVCSLFHHADCNSVLEGPMSNVYGISWSEVGMGYFMANILLLSLFPISSAIVAIINWGAMLYGVWSIYYQWRVVKSWCVLCVIAQIVVWIMGITAGIHFWNAPFVVDVNDSMLSCIVFAVSIMLIHQYAMAYVSDKERERTVQHYRAIKANVDVAKALIEKGEFYQTTLDDSSIIFGNTQGKMRVTILSNPHCNPCARMHEHVESLLRISKNEICVQYIFMAFSKELEDSSRYLISCYFNNSNDEALRKFALWYAKDKFDYKKIIKENKAQLYTDKIDREMEKHRMWREKSSLVATPTVLVNGHVLPIEYEVGELALIVNK